MVGMINGQTQKVPLQEVAGKLKMVQPDTLPLFQRQNRSESLSVIDSLNQEEQKGVCRCLIRHYTENIARENLKM